MKQILLLMLALSMPFSTAIADQTTGVVHVVLIWLKDAGNAEHRQQIINGSKKLAEIPGVLDLQVGNVIESDRDVVEDSYDVGLYLRFANRDDLQSYLSHPMHTGTVKEQFVPIMARFRVFDFETPSQD